jgi:hypothetical protein
MACSLKGRPRAVVPVALCADLGVVQTPPTCTVGIRRPEGKASATDAGGGRSATERGRLQAAEVHVKAFHEEEAGGHGAILASATAVRNRSPRIHPRVGRSSGAVRTLRGFRATEFSD